MSYARVNDKSDVYIYPTTEGKLRCFSCDIVTTENFDSDRPGMLVHLEEHCKLGHKIPEKVLDRLKEEIAAYEARIQDGFVVGCRVKFVGPEYKYQMGFTNRPFLGQEGTLIAREGYTASSPGEDPKELVLVQFDGDKQRSNVCLWRLELVKTCPHPETV